MYNGIGLRESLKQLPPEELQAMLQAELERETPDPDAVRLILDILKEDTSEPDTRLSVQKQAAWNRYQQRISGLRRKSAGNAVWIVRAASLLVVVGLLFAVVPQKAEADTFWEMLQKWTASVVSFLDWDEILVDVGYVFKTDNPGLQQVYDAVTELGVTEPMVPMWLPDGYVLSELENKTTPMMKGVWALFVSENDDIVYKINVYDGEPAHQYYKDDSHYESFEKNGTIFHVARNINRWTVIWSIDNIECSMFVDCQEEALRRILGSIYEMEDG